LFTEAHKQAFGYDRDDAIELVNLRLRALTSAGRVKFTDLMAQGSVTEQRMSVSRQAYFGPAHGTLETPVRQRADMAQEQQGPLIVEEPDTTVVVPPGWSVRRDEYGNLALTKA
ncbi:MAG: hydantoinase/oxoprolinase family protein, partial [Deltaproteobacteria bacterium]|nr:hydantoinase/oxoprolinase family protein [Deltaproteobacteria bacterium]